MYSIQKFHRLLVNGIIANNVSVQVLSAMPVSLNHPKKWWYVSEQKENGALYHYIPFLNLRFIRQIFLFFYSFGYVLFHGINRKHDIRVIFDVLNISVCFGGLLAAKLVRLPAAGIVTDLPGLMIGEHDDTIKAKFIASINRSYLSAFDYYILLTEQMNEVVNIKHKPYLVMEGLVDSEMTEMLHSSMYKDRRRKIIYAGGLYERYGVKMLLDAFRMLPFDDIELSIYGMGEMEAQMQMYQDKDQRIKYYGVVPNEKIVEAELNASLLVNPRPTHEEFVKYSFPSKNMEYMVSGTPVLTTRLPGMPKEYYDFVYFFDEESINGYYNKLFEILSLPEQELVAKGEAAKRFVLEYKNNRFQANRILKLIA